MAEKVTSKRTSRVTFVGVSNLGQEKAFKLRDILQEIITHLSELHASCDDKKIKVEDKFRKVKDLSGLQRELETLVSIANDQVNLCSSANDVQGNLVAIKDQIASNTDHLIRLFKSYSAGGDEGFQIVERLLDEVKYTVDLLRAADHYTIVRVEQMTKEVADLADAVYKAQDAAVLLDAAKPLMRSALETKKIAESRSVALENNPAAKESADLLRTAGAAVGDLTPQVVVAVRQALNSGSSPSPVPLSDLKKALHDIAHATRVSPEFAVIFDVDYLDSELAKRLAALGAFVRAGDRMGVSGAGKAVDKELERRINLAKKDPKYEPVIAAVKAAQADAHTAARAALEARISFPEPNHPAYLAADAKMTQEFNRLKQAAEGLPDAAVSKTSTQVPLIQAARALSLELWGLLRN